MEINKNYMNIIMHKLLEDIKAKELDYGLNGVKVQILLGRDETQVLLRALDDTTINETVEKAVKDKESKTENFIKHKIDYLENLASIETNEGRWVEEEKYLYAVSVLEEVVEYIKTRGDGEE